MGLSCLLFRQADLFGGLCAFAEHLKAHGYSLMFHSTHTGTTREVTSAWEEAATAHPQ
jgi:hypothetical protein